MRPLGGGVDHTADGLTPSVSGHACLTAQRPGAPCTACHDTCPADAITVQGRRIAISASSCYGCRRCATACPTGAIAAGPGLTTSPNSQHVQLECSRVPARFRHADANVVSCLGGVTVNELLHAVAEGATAISFIDRGWCASCPAGGLSEPWLASREAVEKLLATLRPDAEISVRVRHLPLPEDKALDLRVAHPPQQLSRRQLFAGLVRPSQPAQAQSSSGSDANRTPARVTTSHLDERRRLLASIAGNRQLPAALFPALNVASTCCNNQVCTRSCPTGALSAWREAGATGLAFDPALCIKCGGCERVCPTRSIAISDAGEGDYVGPSHITRHRLALCTCCDNEFVPNGGATTCPACGKDRDLAAAGFRLMRRTRAPDEVLQSTPQRQG